MIKVKILQKIKTKKLQFALTSLYYPLLSTFYK